MLVEKVFFKRTFENDFETINSVGAIHWIGNEEVLLIFRGFATILRIDPFSDIIDLKFPYSISQFEFKTHCKSSIVPFISQSLNLQFFDSSTYRSRCKPENWQICNEIFMDSIMITRQKYDDRAPIRILDFAQQFNELLIFVAHDGQPLLYRKIGAKFEFLENLTDKILKYSKNDSQLLKKLRSKSIPDEKYLEEAWNFLNVARFVAVQSWIFAKIKNLTLGFSIQRDNSIVVWRWENGKINISNVYRFFENEKISCLYAYVDYNSNFLIYGSSRGNLYSSKISVDEANSFTLESPRLIKSFDDNSRIFNVIVKDIGSCPKFIVSKNASFFVADISMVDDNISLKNHRIIDSISRFPCTNLISSRESIIGYCADNCLRINTDMSLSNIQSIVGVKNRQMGLGVSKNRSLLLNCSLRECIDRQYCKQPNEITIVFGELNRVWRETMAKNGAIDQSLDNLLCIRQAILNINSDITLFIAEFFETLKKPETVDLYHLKVGRFILQHMKTRIFHSGASEEEMIKFETLIIGVEKMLVKYRAGILMNSSLPSNVVDQAKQIFDADMSKDTPLNLDKPCPICGTKNLLSSSRHSIELVCENNHTIRKILLPTFDFYCDFYGFSSAMCCRSLLIIDEFSYDKCSRCGLSSIKNCPVESWRSEVFGKCSMCDGMIVPSDL